MNNEKLNTHDLVTEISAKTNETKKDIDIFLREFIALIQETLFEDKIVKVKGLGTFKLLWNESRKSVNVQTGEDIEIPGHYKVTFTPENELKEAVNEPFAHLETVMLDEDDSEQEEKTDPSKNFSMQALEIASIISEINSPEKTEEIENQIEQETVVDNIEPKIETQQEEPLQAIEVVKEEQSVSEIVDESKNDILPIEEPEKDIQSEKIITDEVAESENKNSETTATEENPTEEKTEEEKEDGIKENSDKKEKKNRWWLWILLLLIFLLFAGLIYCCFINKECFCAKSENTEQVIPVESEITEEIKKETQPEQPQPEPEQPTYSFNANEYEADIVTVRKGTRLAWFSTKYYGNHMFWPYIYLANKDVLSSPDDLKEGMQIKVPRLPKEMIDPCNQQVVEQVEYIKEHLSEF